MDMPEDAILEILLWLPVISLLRFKTVCKSWRSLIQSPEFIHLHQEQSKLNPNGNIIISNTYTYRSQSPRSSLSLSLLSGNNFENFQNIDFPFKFEQKILEAEIKATCNGVICLQVRTVEKSPPYLVFTHLFLWNPATRQIRLLPELVDHERHRYLGFGYDVKTHDYKVVKFFIKNSDNYEDNCRVCLYSLSSNSWTTTKAGIPIRFVSSAPKGIAPYWNRLCCWLGKYIFKENGYLKHSYSILAFDFSKEVFECIPLPEVYSSDPSNLKLVLLAEKIGCIICQSRFSKRGDWHCQIWILNEYGVKESWTKIYSLRLENEAYALGATLDGRIIWYKYIWYKYVEKKDTSIPKSELHLCDPVTQKLTMLPIETLSLRFSVAVYKGSLVSLL